VRQKRALFSNFPCARTLLSILVGTSAACPHAAENRVIKFLRRSFGMRLLDCRGAGALACSMRSSPWERSQRFRDERTGEELSGFIQRVPWRFSSVNTVARSFRRNCCGASLVQDRCTSQSLCLRRALQRPGGVLGMRSPRKRTESAFAATGG
jgi:hypothetical protein